MRKIIFITLFISSTCSANVFNVGSTRSYVSPNALYLANVVQDGDTIEIDAETYTDASSLAVWQADDLVTKGIGRQPRFGC